MGSFPEPVTSRYDRDLKNDDDDDDNDGSENVS